MIFLIEKYFVHKMNAGIKNLKWISHWIGKDLLRLTKLSFYKDMGRQSHVQLDKNMS